jgi:hypothetical protein
MRAHAVPGASPDSVNVNEFVVPPWVGVKVIGTLTE